MPTKTDKKPTPKKKKPATKAKKATSKKKVAPKLKLKPTDKVGRKRPRLAKKVKVYGPKRYLFTSAQNNTAIHEQFFSNLQVLCEHYTAEIHVSRFIYRKRGLGALGNKDQNYSDSQQELEWDSRVLPFLSDDDLQIAPDLVWCGRMNILPTAVNPLRGFETYTRSNSGIYPHAKIALQSLPTMKGTKTRMNYTTGACTLRNYIVRKAGLKAEFHHCFGALLVEVDEDGTWFARQINGNDKGTIHDLTLKVENGNLTSDNRILAVNYGDIHVWQVDENVIRGSITGKNSLQKTLKPKYQFFHDVLDFKVKNHHDTSYVSKIKKNPHTSVLDEVKATFAFLDKTTQPWCQSVVVHSNHDAAFDRWLDSSDYKEDPLNAEFYLESQLARTKAILAKDSNFTMMRWLSEKYSKYKTIRYLKEDESLVLKGIEFGLHGDKGPNGSRGSISSLSKMGCKINIGHSHSAIILGGCFQSGCCTVADLGYNKGPNTHSHSHIITYTNGKRAIVTCQGDRWKL